MTYLEKELGKRWVSFFPLNVVLSYPRLVRMAWLIFSLAVPGLNPNSVRTESIRGKEDYEKGGKEKLGIF